MLIQPVYPGGAERIEQERVAFLAATANALGAASAEQLAVTDTDLSLGALAAKGAQALVETQLLLEEAKVLLTRFSAASSLL